jgi:FMN phosphatase YigB (HAD superfamily)
MKIYAKHLIFDLDNTLIDTHGSRQVYPDVQRVIMSFVPKQDHTITLLTAGDSLTQWSKIMRCSLIGYFAAIIVVPEQEDKGRGLSALMAAYPTLFSRQTIIIGDRPDAEITYANQLGCTSVRIVRGKHAERMPACSTEIATHNISSLDLLERIVEGIE